MQRPRTPEEWLEFHEFREGGIGGSEAPIIARVSPWCTPFELWLRRKKIIAPQPQSYPMLRGIKFEPLARAAYERITGIPMPAAQRVNPQRPELRGNFDGINDLVRRSIEIKCPGKDDHHIAKVEKRVPKKYLPQCRHLIAVPGHDAQDYVSFDVRGLERLLWELGWRRLFELMPLKDLEARTAIIEVKRDREQEEILLEAESKFWKCLQTDTPPPIDEPPAPKVTVPAALPTPAPQPEETKERIEIFKARKNRNRIPKAKKCPYCKRAVISGAAAHTHCERIHAKKNFQLTLIKGVPNE